MGAEAFDYLAGPFWHKDADVRSARFQAMTIIAAKHAEAGQVVFSPITYGFHLAAQMPIRDQRNGGFWKWLNGPFVQSARGMIVVKLPGWEVSEGLKAEIEAFTAAGKPIEEITEPLRLLPAVLCNRLLAWRNP